MAVIDTASKKVTEKIPVGKAPDGWAVDPGPPAMAYVTNSGEDSVSVIEPSARKVTGTVKVGKGPDGITVDPTTHTVYTANADDDSVSVIATR